MNTDEETERKATPEEIAQLERERTERLDPANRPANAQVDNTQREWVSDAKPNQHTHG